MFSTKPIVLADKASISKQVLREREAYAYLQFLAHLQPSGAAPFTNEDMAIFARALKRNGRQFVIYAEGAYADYRTFFLSALNDAQAGARARLT